VISDIGVKFAFIMIIMNLIICANASNLNKV
jgi:hypothetical protein